MSGQIDRFARNKTLFGLRTNAKIRMRFSCDVKAVTEVVGLDVPLDEVEVSDNFVFNIPQFVVVGGVPYFPSKYEASKGDVWYHARSAPSGQVNLFRPYGALSDRAKIMKVRLTPEMLAEFDKPRSRRPRDLTQKQVMGESAALHAQRLIERGDLIVSDGVNVQWHWCHLVAYTMLPEHRAQVRRNLFAGTSACNGHLANIEAAVKIFIYETQRPVSLEVTVNVLANTHVGHRVRYRIWEPKSGVLHSEYFDALNHVQSDYIDFERVYEELRAKFS